MACNGAAMDEMSSGRLSRSMEEAVLFGAPFDNYQPDAEARQATAG